jgi:hypothetical protein
MQDRSELIPWVVAWVITSAYIIKNQWSRRLPSVGLPFAYILSLSMIHFFGGLIYSFPWYSPKNAYLLQSGATFSTTSLGFVESTYGIVAFGIGSTIVAESIVRFSPQNWLKDRPQQPDWQLPKIYLYTGILFVVAINPVLSQFAGFAAFTTSGVSLFVVGLCLSCWQAWCDRDVTTFWKYVGITCCLPIFTVITMGFMSYGAAAASAVLVFIFSFYRPRWRVLIAAFLALALGLSVYVTYIRDRNDLRAQAWGGRGLDTRIEQFTKTFQKFEIIDFFNQNHLEAIDVRLNQNDLVGKSVDYLENRRASEYANGETLWTALIAPIPRILWPSKPEFGGSGGIVTRYTGQSFAVGTSVGVGQVLEFYLNFGTSGVIVGFLIFGTILRLIDIVAGHKLLCGNLLGFTTWFLPGLAMLQPINALSEIVGSISGSVVLMVLINKFYVPKTRQVQVSRLKPKVKKIL